MSSLILASGSTIRKQILTQAGLDFSVIVKPVDEAAIKASMMSEKAAFTDIVATLAQIKTFRVSCQNEGLVIGADQILVMDGLLFDKPENLDEVADRLWSMRGKKHNLINAVIVSRDGKELWRYINRTDLYVREFSRAFLETYIQTEGEILLQTVGAYRFEGMGVQIFSRVEGDFFSILGLSLLPLLEFLRQSKAISS